ncbi:TolC family outer membrane protein [Pararhodobacter oceanensis]|uniref:TolC family outer membrane protein n=1 Tax=Pararhodobacter oceanensis TaxID=2172121 RepID=UPI003A90FB40
MGFLIRMRTVARAAVLGVGLSGLAAFSAQAETLADALVAAYQNSNLLDQNRALLRASDEDVQQAIAALGPVVEFVSTAMATRGTSTGYSTTYSMNFALSVSATLFDFGRSRMAVEATREQVLSARAGLVAVEQNVLFDAAQAYMSLFSEMQTVELQRNSVSVIEEQLRAARERFELGDSTRTDVAIAQARLAAARSGLAAAQGNVAVAREQFNLVVGRYPGSLRQPPRLPTLPSSLAAAQDIARRFHPAITQAQHQVTAADLATEIAGTQRMGTVTGGLTAQSTIIGSSSDTDSLSANMRYAVPIYNGGRLNSAERQAVARGEAQRAALHQMVATVQQAVAANWSQLQVARATLAAGDLQIEASQSAYDAVRAEVELGSRTTLDLLNAEQELLDARSARIQASTTVQVAAYALLNSMGQMTVEALRLGIPTYDVEAYGAGLRGGSPRATPSEQGIRLDRIMGRHTTSP